MQEEPFLHGGLRVHQSAFVHMSVRFIRLSRYWQYVTLCGKTKSVSDFMRSRVRNIPRGFSMNTK
jgi:hypothetical protein